MFILKKNLIYICLYWKKKSYAPEPGGQFQSNLAYCHPWVKGILNCSNKGPSPLQRGDNHKHAKMRCGSFKNLLQNHIARIGHIYMKVFWYNVDSNFFKSWSLGATIGKTIFTFVYIGKNLLLQNQQANFNQT
jgi:hypothetical protein